MIEDPAFRQRLDFRRETEPDGGEVLYVAVWIDPGGGVPTPHVHPSMEERFKVFEGTASFLSGREWVDAGPGEEVVVPAGTRHAYRNRSDAPTHFVCEARPPSTLQEFLEGTAALSRAGKITRRGFPKPGGLLDGMVLVNRHRHMAVLGFPPLPPAFLQPLLLPPLAALGERLGHGPERLTRSS